MKFEYLEDVKAIQTSKKIYYFGEITPELMYEWMVTGKISKKAFIAWGEYIYECNPC